MVVFNWVMPWEEVFGTILAPLADLPLQVARFTLLAVLARERGPQAGMSHRLARPCKA